MTKSSVSHWITVATFESILPLDDGESLCSVEVQIGCADDTWYVRTTDNVGGSDEAGDTEYDSEDDAREAAMEIAEANDESEE